MEISVLQPLEQAWDRMVRVCFRPFDVAKWFTLGFCAWLASLASGGGGFNSGGSSNNNRGSGGGSKALDAINYGLQWCADHALLVVVGVAVVFVWLRSRGEFMFIDGIAKNRGAVVEPWRAFKPLGNSLFLVRMAMSVISSLWVFALLLLGLFSIAPTFFGHLATLGNDITFGNLFPGDMLLIFGSLVALSLALLFTLVLVNAVIDQLIVPVMYARDATVGRAWHQVRTELLPGHLTQVVLFYLTLLVVFCGLGVITIVATLVTCCFAALPYIGAVILLPLTVFKRSYVLYFVEQFGFEVFRFEDSAAELGPPWSAKV